MAEEFAALVKQDPWILTPFLPGKSAIGCKSIYRINRNSDGSISCYKARLVANGYHQEEGIDYDETFSHIVKKPTVRIILSLASQFGWNLRQFDVKNVFLYGEVHEKCICSSLGDSLIHQNHIMYAN